MNNANDFLEKMKAHSSMSKLAPLFEVLIGRIGWETFVNDIETLSDLVYWYPTWLDLWAEGGKYAYHGDSVEITVLNSAVRDQLQFRAGMIERFLIRALLRRKY